MSHARTSASDFCRRRFDVLIVGGGTAGLAVASRLSEVPDLEVGVLEAGPYVEGHEDVDVPGRFGSTLGTGLDWQFETVPQPGLGGRSLAWPRGRCLGGTSLLNFMTWNRASRQDYDAWEELGCEGWGWEGILPFMKKSENFHPPSHETQRRHQAHYDPASFGTAGPIEVSYAAEYSASHQHWHETLGRLGIETNKAHMAGSNVGGWTNLGSVDPATCTRSSSATAYYRPIRHRPNLAVLTHALVQHVDLHKSSFPSSSSPSESSASASSWQARGVRFTDTTTGDIHTVAAAREVLLCAGSVQSPQLLELSGVGRPEVLARAGVAATKVASPRVGENLQDHLMAASIYEVDPSLPNPDDLRADDPAAAAAAREAYHASRSGPLTVLANSVCYLGLSRVLPPGAPLLADLARRAAAEGGSGDFPERDEIRRRRFDPASPELGQIEYFFDLGNWNPFFHPQDPAKKYGTVLQILQYPFSRGSVHIASASAHDKPTIDPAYYGGGGGGGALDLEVMVACARFAERLTQTPPLAGIVRGRVAPPAGAGTDEALREWLVRETICDWHPIGTCGMGGRRGIEGGVVDERPRVYGVRGLRVIDASIMPMQISAHLQATVYAIAEKGAHMILEDWGFRP